MSKLKFTLLFAYNIERKPARAVFEFYFSTLVVLNLGKISLSHLPGILYDTNLFKNNEINNHISQTLFKFREQKARCVNLFQSGHPKMVIGKYCRP